MKTAMQILKDDVKQIYDTEGKVPIAWLLDRINRLENNEEIMMVTQAIMHALDEDGHTGSWKVEFASNYYKNKYNERSV